jgi:iron complex outermembrane receptor protein
VNVRVRNLALLLALPVPLEAVSATAAPRVAPEVVVSATREEAREFDLPAAIDTVDSRVVREDNPQVNLSESLNRIPGIVVQNRQNYAQDLQVSSRGFGARAAFGVRGVRLVADGIPATMPDGQGQSATFALSSASRIEVLRGPFALLYGNASGGFIETFTEDGPERPTVRPSFSAGSYDAYRAGIVFGGTQGALNYLLDASRFQTDGYREHSAARRDHLNAKFRIAFDTGAKLTAVLNALDQPDTKDPLGLRRAQMDDDPRQADPAAILFDTRKSIEHRQGGLVYEHPVGGGDTLRLSAYGGARDVVQYLSIPLGPQMAPTSGGGVVDLDRSFGGAAVRYTFSRETGSGPVKLTAGFQYDRMDEHRTGFINNFGRRGALKRDQDDEVSNTDAFAIAEWSFAPRWVLAGGARASRVRFESRDHFIAPGNPDDSGSVKHSGHSLALGLLHKLSDQLHLYAAAGRGFETPTLAELSYRPDGTSGLNFDLEPSRSEQVEAGVKLNLRSGQRIRFTVFSIDTRDEIVVNSASGGRTDFKNAGRTRRRGVETSWEAVYANGIEAYVSWSWIDAHYRNSFTSGSSATLVPAGNRLPGVAASTLFAELLWRHEASGFHAAVEARRVGRVAVDDANSEFAGSYAVASARLGLEQRGRQWRLTEFARIDNLTDRRYAGSVIVADGNRRFYEPAPGRNYLLGIEAAFAF